MPPTNHGWWMAWTLDTDESIAVQAFRERFGVAPQTIVRDHLFLWLGPVAQIEPAPVEEIPAPEIAEQQLALL